MWPGYSKNLEQTNHVLDFFEQHPVHAGIRSLFHSWITRWFPASRNTAAFHLVTHLSLMGLNDAIPNLRAQLKIGNGDQEKLQNFVHYLYAIFDQLSKNLANEDLSDDEKQAYCQSLGKLKKLIHQFARENNIDLRLFNLQKLKLKLEAEYEKSEQKNETLEGQINYVDELLKKRLTFAYIAAGEKGSSIEPVTTPMERHSRQRAKFWLNVASLAVSLIVGVGEALVAAVFIASAIAFPPLIIVVAIAAFCCNFYLFRGDSYPILKDIYFGTIWKRPNGEQLSKVEKGFVAFSLIFSFCAAAAFGFLSFGSGMTAFASIFALIGLASNPIGLMVLAGFIALVTTIALFTVFSYMTVNFIRHDGHKKLYRRIRHLKKDLINYWKHENWLDLTLEQKIKHVLERSIRALLNILFTLLAVAAVVLLVIATAGLFKHKAATIFHATFKLSRYVSNILAIVIINVIGGPVNALFYAKGIVGLMKVLKSTVVDIASAIRHPIRTYHSIKSSLSGLVKNPVRAVHSLLSKIGRTFLSTCIAINGAAQGAGPGKDTVALSWAHSVTRLPVNVVSKLNFTVMTGGSSGPNYAASVAVTELYKGVESEIAKKAIPKKAEEKAKEEPVNESKVAEFDPNHSSDVIDESKQSEVLSKVGLFSSKKVGSEQIKRSKSIADFHSSTANNPFRITNSDSSDTERAVDDSVLYSKSKLGLEQ